MRDRRLVRALLVGSLVLGAALVSMQVRGARSIRTIRDPGRISGSTPARATEPAASAPVRTNRARAPGVETEPTARRAETSSCPVPAARMPSAIDGESSTPVDPQSSRGGPGPATPADDRDEPLAGIENRFDAIATVPRPGQEGLLYGAPALSAVPRSPQTDAQKARGPAAVGSDGASGGGSGVGSPGTPPLTLTLVPAPDDRSPSDRLRIQVVLSGAQEITSVPLHVRFDPEVLEFLGATTGRALEEGRLQPILLASVNSHRPGDLAVGLALIGGSGTFTGSGTVALLEFRTLRTGRTELALDQASVRGVTGEPLPVRIEGIGVQVR
jgi:hypothetical protein